MRYFTFLFIILTTQLSFSQVRFQNIPDGAIYPEQTFFETITATIPYQGYDEAQVYYGQGEFEIFLDTYNGILNKPIIVLDGFDPGDSRSIGDIYAGLSFGGQNFADVLRREGFDIVILNAPVYTSEGKVIDGGSDYIQRNAMVLIALIEQLNTDKVGEEELVVLGPSMGGLIARYALAYMEANNLETETRLFISADTPHRGANIPISIQYLINYFAEQVGDVTAQQVVNQLLKSPAAKEMLVDHLEGHLLLGSTYEQDPTQLLPVGAPGFRNEFQAELDNLGFPSNTRNVTIINGSGIGITTGSPGMTVVNTNLEIDATTDVDVALKFTPVAGETNTVTDVTVNFIGFPVNNYLALSESPTTTDGVDSAPGGTGSISDALGDGGGNQVLIDFINALQQDLYSFIPTMSALAIDTPDWFAAPNLSNSPFAAFSIPDENQPHGTMTPVNIQFTLDEIRNGVVGISENQFDSGFVLVQNPVKNSMDIAILGNTSGETTTTTVYSVTGQKLMEQTWDNPQQQIKWSHNLAGGIYLLNLDNGIATQTIKMVVE
ncbi:T9SS type A sorting domain-containing protein [Aequorivita viscosa]|uniref:Por secretion system C-terminal sorting domain-containing protein n=1 Tax=Aequorivita viscosa TaxID=797419 RepID=A0A1M6FDI0_9FLAO|nr:T9SS type A sorting domain-containing protein [Aequorivita viscosa]SDW67622.1 Por secretion system C-terminal sorting domain-containing protein [Aequorivita viscosa]SHI95727.1 Por secretion system C-terminal sorting domain-containing protein [Aequorivita viscosa]